MTAKRHKPHHVGRPLSLRRRRHRRTGSLGPQLRATVPRGWRHSRQRQFARTVGRYRRTLCWSHPPLRRCRRLHPHLRHPSLEIFNYILHHSGLDTFIREHSL